MKTQSTKFFIYARKSTKGDDKQAQSIESQFQILRKLVKDQNLDVVECITERESAHVPGRPEFNTMMKRIEMGEAAGIIAWHPDRLARNSMDGGQIIHYLDIGKLVDLKFASFWFENTPQGKSNLGHEFVQTKQYSDKLACDTKRGLMQKARNGIYPSKAPRGYLNNRLTKTVVPDPCLAPIVKRAFEVYAEGASTLDDMKEFFAENGILTKRMETRFRGGLKLHQDWIRRFLRNPFYYGHFEYAGERYEGRHEPIISKDLFDRVQRVLERRTHHFKAARQSKPLAGLFHCGECGMMVTAEVQKGHTYYRCSKKSKGVKCSQPFVRAENLTTQLEMLLAAFTLRGDWADEMLRLVDVEEQNFAETALADRQKKQAEISVITSKLQKLLDAYLEELIDRDAFTAQKRKLMEEKKTLQGQVESLEGGASNSWLEPFRKWILTAKTLSETVHTGSLEAKKALAQEVFGSNLFLDRKKARGSASKPWSLLTEKLFWWNGAPARTRT